MVVLAILLAVLADGASYNYKHTAFLIGDSKIDGKDQIFSESMGFAPASPYSFAELNARKLREARAFVEQNRDTNIRIVHQ